MIISSRMTWSGLNDVHNMKASVEWPAQKVVNMPRHNYYAVDLEGFHSTARWSWSNWFHSSEANFHGCPLYNYSMQGQGQISIRVPFQIKSQWQWFFLAEIENKGLKVSWVQKSVLLVPFPISNSLMISRSDFWALFGNSKSWICYPEHFFSWCFLFLALF